MTNEQKQLLCIAFLAACAVGLWELLTPGNFAAQILVLLCGLLSLFAVGRCVELAYRRRK